MRAQLPGGKQTKTEAPSREANRESTGLKYVMEKQKKKRQRRPDSNSDLSNKGHHSMVKKKNAQKTTEKACMPSGNAKSQLCTLKGMKEKRKSVKGMGKFKKITAAIEFDRSLFGKMECSKNSPKSV